MTHMDKKIAEKVKKLLALAGSPNADEAALATSKAQEIMEKYGMSMSDVDIRTAEILEDDFFVNYLHGKNERYVKVFTPWALRLLGVIQKFFYVKVVTSSGRTAPNAATATGLSFIGSEEDVQISRYVFEYLYREIHSMSNGYLKTQPKWSVKETRDMRMSYCLGVVSGIDAKLQQERDSKPKPQTSTGSDLVVVKGAAIQEYVAEKYKGRLRSQSSRTSQGRNYSAREQGSADGRSMSIRRGVSGGSGQLRIGN